MTMGWPGLSQGAVGLLDIALIATAGALTWLAFRTGRPSVAIVAGCLGATIGSAVVMCGWFVIPLLFVMWRRKPGVGYGVVFFVTLVASAMLIPLRLPWPCPLPTETAEHVPATIGAIKSVHKLWEGRRTRGEWIPVHFQVVSLTLSNGHAASMTLADTIDSGSVAGLRKGATVHVAYWPTRPDLVRIDGASRSYAWAALVRFYELMYGIGFAAVLCIAALRALGRVMFPRGSPFRRVLDANARVHALGQLPDDEARRRALEDNAAQLRPPMADRIRRPR